MKAYRVEASHIRQAFLSLFGSAYIPEERIYNLAYHMHMRNRSQIINKTATG